MSGFLFAISSDSIPNKKNGTGGSQFRDSAVF
jgi:hypothetical protein